MSPSTLEPRMSLSQQQTYAWIYSQSIRFTRDSGYYFVFQGFISQFQSSAVYVSIYLGLDEMFDVRLNCVLGNRNEGNAFQRLEDVGLFSGSHNQSRLGFRLRELLNPISQMLPSSHSSSASRNNVTLGVISRPSWSRFCN